MYRSAMVAHIEEIPSWKKYHKTRIKPEMASALAPARMAAFKKLHKAN
jgi:hypothetical protein